MSLPEDYFDEEKPETGFEELHRRAKMHEVYPETEKDKPGPVPTKQTDFSGGAKCRNGACASEGHPITSCIDYKDAPSP